MFFFQKGQPFDCPFGREEVTRTPDPYVPNVVRYQLRYFSKFPVSEISSESLESSLFYLS